MPEKYVGVFIELQLVNMQEIVAWVLQQMYIPYANATKRNISTILVSYVPKTSRVTQKR